MWLCKQCGYTNNTSSQKCHGINCKALRESGARELPRQLVKEREVKKVYDFCPQCKKDTFWLKDRYKDKTAWRCISCNRLAFLKGKSKPFPEVELNAEV